VGEKGVRSRAEEVPDHLRRYPTRAGREALAVRLGLTIDPYSQDWEWEVAAPKHFQRWLAIYRNAPLTDDERFSLMEMLVQCVEEMSPDPGTQEQVEQLPEWQAVATLLRLKPRLHASTICYWSLLGHEKPEQQFRVSVPMRRLWQKVQHLLAEPDAADRPRD
jgi:hypothetical protein